MGLLKVRAKGGVSGLSKRYTRVFAEAAACSAIINGRGSQM